MTPQPERACLLIADISGYTQFFEDVEIDHAHDIIADLMNTVVKALRPRFKVAKFEGDAVFAYAPPARVDGSGFQDSVEGTYFAFRKRLRTIKQATSCSCNACRGMQALDLKFVCHEGAFMRHRIAGREELSGRDVILVHRLLKNGVKERLGGHAYALYSEACAQAQGLAPETEGLIPHAESIDVIGDVRCWVRDLEAAWVDDTARRGAEVTRKAAAHGLDLTIAAPRAVVWSHFTDPDLRPLWRAADSVREDTTGGRRGVGTTNHCMHGEKAIIEEVLEWHPPESVTLTTLLPAPGAPKIAMTYVFSETAHGGTHVEIRIGRPKPKDKDFVDHAFAHFAKTITAEVDVLRGMIESVPEAGPAEPVPPASGERFLTHPVPSA